MLWECLVTSICVDFTHLGHLMVPYRVQSRTILESVTMQNFIPGQVYYGTLACAHGDFPVTCTKRTEQSVWFTKPGYRDMRCKIHRWSDNTETARFHGWYVSAEKQSGGDFDPMTI